LPQLARSMATNASTRGELSLRRKATKWSDVRVGPASLRKTTPPIDMRASDRVPRPTATEKSTEEYRSRAAICADTLGGAIAPTLLQ
jgi:hypothetical protein